MAADDVLTAPLTAEQEEVKEGFIRRRGYWAPDWEIAVRLDPAFLRAYTDVSAFAAENVGLEPYLRELIYVAGCTSATHLHPIGILSHGRNALAWGATPEQVLAVLELVSTLGVASVHLGARAVAAEFGLRATESGEQSALRAEFEELLRAPSDEAGPAIDLLPAYYASLLNVMRRSRGAQSALSPREVALISFSVNALVTHRDAEALRRDIAFAVEAGVTPKELLGVCLQIAGVGIHAVTIGVPIIAELIGETEGGVEPG